MKPLAIVVACFLPLTALAVEQKKSFDVASVKPSTPPGGGGDGHTFRVAGGPRFGPGTPDSTRWACDNCSLGLLLTQAYNLKRFQIAGPAWLDTQRFDITARVPEGATKDDLRLMQQNLLVERFGLKARLEKKEMQVYNLVLGKSPLKLKAAAPAKPGAAGAADAPQTHSAAGHGEGRGAGAGGGAGGFAGFSFGSTDRTSTITMHGSTKHQAVGEDMQEFADMLASQLDRPVTDSTALTGKYDFTLTFSGGKASTFGGAAAMAFHGPASGPGGPGGTPGLPTNDGLDSDAQSQPPLQKAIQDQLGLRLDGQKGMADILVIDHLEKVPSEN